MRHRVRCWFFLSLLSFWYYIGGIYIQILVFLLRPKIAWLSWFTCIQFNVPRNSYIATIFFFFADSTHPIHNQWKIANLQSHKNGVSIIFHGVKCDDDRWMYLWENMSNLLGNTRKFRTNIRGIQKCMRWHLEFLTWMHNGIVFCVLVSFMVSIARYSSQHLHLPVTCTNWWCLCHQQQWQQNTLQALWEMEYNAQLSQMRTTKTEMVKKQWFRVNDSRD